MKTMSHPLWLSEVGAYQANMKVNAHLAEPDPHPQYEMKLAMKLDAVVPPTVNDDSTAGFTPRSIWFDVAAGEAYRCLIAEPGAAVWVQTSLTIDELGSAAMAQVEDFATASQGDTADSAVQPADLEAVAYSGSYLDLYNRPVNVTGTVDGFMSAGDKVRLDSMETGATADQTAAEILQLLLTVAGAGSGLDADKLDGKQLATLESDYRAYADAAIAALVDSSPATLDTLNELAAALGNDPEFATTVSTQIGQKLDAALYTAADVLAKLLAVDGAGSGLDADKLDGLHAAAFATAAQGSKADSAVQPGQLARVATSGDYADLAGTPGAATITEAGLMAAADKAKLNGIESGATADQTGAEIKTAYEGEANTNAYTDTEKTKVGYLTVTAATDLDIIRSRVNDLDSAIQLKGDWDASLGSFPSGAKAGWTYIVSVAGTVDSIEFNVNDRLLCLVDGASTSVYATNWLKLDYTDQVISVFGRSGAVTAQSGDYNAGQIDETASAKIMTVGERTKLGGIEPGATADQTASEIKTAYEANTDTNAFTDAEKAKLGGIEAGATGDQTGSEIKVAYEANPDTNAYTDAEKVKLSNAVVQSQLDGVNAQIGDIAAALNQINGEVV